MKKAIYDFSFDELSALLSVWGLPGYRARQLWEWLYVRKVTDFAQMTSLPANLRARLADEFVIGRLEQTAEMLSSDGQTVKRLLRLPDGQMIESVLMEYDDERRTACISTQAGCAMGFFCKPGRWAAATCRRGDRRQALMRQQAQGERLSNIVLMGRRAVHGTDNDQAIRRLATRAG